MGGQISSADFGQFSVGVYTIRHGLSKTLNISLAVFPLPKMYLLNELIYTLFNIPCFLLSTKCKTEHENNALTHTETI